MNSICPGFTATDVNNNTGTQTVEEGAVAIVRFAQQADSGLAGGFFHKDGILPLVAHPSCPGCRAKHISRSSKLRLDGLGSKSEVSGHE